MPQIQKFCLVLSLVALLANAPVCRAQSGLRPDRTQQDQDAIRIFTEEVRLSVAAFDDKDRPDPTLEINDLLVFEDGVQQEVRSIRRVSASVLLVIETSGELDPALRTSTSRDAALNLIRSLPAGDRMSLLQFTSRPELLQDWTVEKSQIEHTLQTKLHSGYGSRLAPALVAAAKQFEDQPIGTRHIVLVTDGVDVPPRASYKEAMQALATNGGAEQKEKLSEAIKRLNAAQATVHVISYTKLARLVMKKGKDKNSAPPGYTQDVADMTVAGIDPTLPPGVRRGGSPSAPTVGAGITFDPQMRRLRKAYEKATEQSERQLTSLTGEMGGILWLPSSSAELVSEGAAVARDIGSEYVVTYAPKRPLANATAGEYRRLQVASRRVGLYLRTRQGYLVSPVSK